MSFIFKFQIDELEFTGKNRFIRQVRTAGSSEFMENHKAHAMSYTIFTFFNLENFRNLNDYFSFRVYLSFRPFIYV